MLTRRKFLWSTVGLGIGLLGLDALAFSGAGHGKDLPDTHLFRVKRGGLYGFINREGEVVIPPSYERARDFSEGLAAVREDGRWGFIDSRGNMAIPPRFDHVIIGFDFGRAPVKIGNRWGYIDLDGRLAIRSIFEDPAPFREGLLAVRQGDALGFIDIDGNIVIRVSIDGTSRADTQWSPSTVFFSEGLAGTRTGGDCVYIDRSGKIALRVRGKYSFPFRQGKAVTIDRSGMHYFIERDGRTAFGGKRFAKAWGFSEGRARFQTSKGVGFVDLSGEVAIPPVYRVAFQFTEGLASVVLEKGKAAYIDHEGRFVIPPRRLDQAFLFQGGLASVMIDGKWGYINKMGEYVWEPT